MQHRLDGGRCDAAVSEATNRVSTQLAALGHHVEEVKLDIGMSWDGFVQANAQFWTANTAAWLDAVAKTTGRTLARTCWNRPRAPYRLTAGRRPPCTCSARCTSEISSRGAWAPTSTSETSCSARPFPSCRS